MLVAIVIFTTVFLLLFVVLGRLTTNLSGSDSVRAAQIADVTLARFQSVGTVPEDRDTVVVDGILFRLLVKSESENELRRLWLTIVRDKTGDTVGKFYTERFEQKDSS